MKIQKIFLLIISFYCIKAVKSQDTIYLESMNELEKIIRIGFCSNIEMLNQKIKDEINTEFNSYSDSIELFQCTSFRYFIELDSCGNIILCEFSRDTSEVEIYNQFIKRVEKIILNSNWQIPNIAILPNSKDYFMGGFVGFSIKCDSDTITYIGNTPHLFEHSRVFAVKNEEEIFYFHGFEYGCPKKEE